MSLPAQTGITERKKMKSPTPDAHLFESFNPLEGKKLEIVTVNGTVAHPEWMPQINDEKLIGGYQIMLLARLADLRAVSLQRQGRLYTLPPNVGQEACAVGSAMAIEKSDWLVQAYRELGSLLYHGVPLYCPFLSNAGSEFGSVYPADVRVTPMSVPISSQTLHAVGIAHAANILGKKEVSIVYFGDGGTSEGDFHEALNWAAVFSCPVIFFCNNNQYAISLPRAEQTKSKTIAQKAVAYGMPGIQVDGNDLFAVYRATKDAADWARSGKGPVLIEAETYRMGAHTTSDDPTKYRNKEEEEAWKPRDPVSRVRKYLEANGLWDERKEQAWKEECEGQIEEAVMKTENWPSNSPEEVFTHVFKDGCAELTNQLVDLKAFLAWKEGK